MLSNKTEQSTTRGMMGMNFVKRVRTKDMSKIIWLLTFGKRLLRIKENVAMAIEARNNSLINQKGLISNS
jgi:hypothetical protein